LSAKASRASSSTPAMARPISMEKGQIISR